MFCFVFLTVICQLCRTLWSHHNTKFRPTVLVQRPEKKSVFYLENYTIVFNTAKNNWMNKQLKFGWTHNCSYIYIYVLKKKRKAFCSVDRHRLTGSLASTHATVTLGKRVVGNGSTTKSLVTMCKERMILVSSKGLLWRHG